MHNNPAIDDTLSGTTAITLLFFGDTMYVANVGDSRAIVAQRVDDEEAAAAAAAGATAAAAVDSNGNNGAQGGPRLKAVPLSDDQTPYRKVGLGMTACGFDAYLPPTVRVLSG